ncbi:YceI family protein [Sandaracinus amylolyticus]|uniref:YceI family protein n=1 Tax=Sandaracinus amylolyticus TaxID=927083 RepID=UPI001F17E649|nr:YceI family protein [Sandaracinus amylolyticus]UJR78572.1 Polyisoprenoid-binding protein YceI [Sandaracinus amylolyticus]
MTTAAPQTASQPSRWTLDASHSSVGFSVRHMMITNVRGEFQKVSGEVVFDPSKPEASKVSATIDVASINTREEKRDGHLRSADFFDAEKHPSMTFESKRVRRAGDGYEVVGDLTIRGTTREVTLTVDDVTAEHTDPWGNRRIGASARAKVRRSEFGMTWNSALEAGGVLVGDEISIVIEVSLIKQA